MYKIKYMFLVFLLMNHNFCYAKRLLSNDAPAASVQINFGDLNRGYDVVTFELRLPVFALVSSGTIIPGTTNMTLPLYATAYRDTESSWANFTLTSFDYIQMYANYGSTFTSESFSGSKDTHVQVWASVYIEDDYSMSDATKTFTVSVVELNPYVTPYNDGFNQTMTYLEANMNEYDYDTLYAYVIKEYGTHVYETANIGAQLRYTVYMHNCVIRERSEAWFSSQVTTDFGMHTDSSSGTHLDSLYEKTQLKAVYAYAKGGTVLIPDMTPANVQLLLSTVPDNPVTTSGILVRLSDVIKMRFPTVSKYLDQAIDEYIQINELNDFPRTKQIFPNYPNQWVGDPNCYPCMSSCMGQSACPGETCKYYNQCNYGKIGQMCAGFGTSEGDTCVRDYENNGGCANIMANNHGWMCECSGHVVGPNTVPCTTDCVP